MIWSRAEMGDRARLIELLRKREVMRMRRVSADLGVTHAEHGRTTAMAEKLAEMIAENAPPKGEITSMTLRARLGLGVKLEAQREIVENRAEFLDKELQQTRRKLAQMKRRETIYGDKAAHERQGTAEARDTAAERLLPPGRRGRPL